MTIAEVSVVPLGTKTPSVSKFVAGAVRVLQAEKDINYEITAMGTIIEGETERLLSLAGKMHQSAFAAGALRVVTAIKIDERRDKPASIASKVEAVRRELGPRRSK
ncbi:MAG: MTH1187 family thiamine-binding protein [Chloroflexi bacterium]|nr:MTH1187 family thiamine-binding protein [Chloroflexota bacterium]